MFDNSMIPRPPGAATPFVLLTPAGVELDPATYADDASCVLAIMRQEFAPGIKDHAGTVPDQDLTTADLGGLEGEERLGLDFSTSLIKVPGQYAPLELLGAVTVVMLVKRIAGGVYDLFAYYGTSGSETEAGNALWGVGGTFDTVGWFTEKNTGTNVACVWRGVHMPIDEWVAMGFTRSASGDVRGYYGGARLAEFDSLDGITDGGDGVGTNAVPSGGTTAPLTMEDAPSWKTAGLLVWNRELTEAEVNAELAKLVPPVDRLKLTSAEIAELQAVPDHICLITYDGSTLVDLSGTYLPGDIITNPSSTYQLTDGEHWIESVAVLDGVYVQLTSSLNARCRYQLSNPPGTRTFFLFGCSGPNPDPNEDNNNLFGLLIDDVNTYHYACEYGLGLNQDVFFNTPETLLSGGLYDVELRRVDIGGGMCEVSLLHNGTLCEVSEINGVPQPPGTYVATVLLSTGGANANFYIDGNPFAGSTTVQGVRYVSIAGV